MISNHLGVISERQPIANELSAQIAQFLAKGGKISEPEANAPRKSISEGRRAPNFQSAAVKAEMAQRVSRVRALAETLNRSEICEQEGITMGVLRGIAKRYAIDFTAGPKKAYAPNKTAAESDAMLVIQVRDCIAKGINRTRCCEDLGISSTLLYRLIKDFDIDYPKLEPAFR